MAIRLVLAAVAGTFLALIGHREWRRRKEISMRKGRNNETVGRENALYAKNADDKQSQRERPATPEEIREVAKQVIREHRPALDLLADK